MLFTSELHSVISYKHLCRVLCRVCSNFLAKYPRDSMPTI